MISRKLIAALVGITLVAGTALDASAKIATDKVATNTIATGKVAGKPIAATTLRHKVVAKHHRLHVSHRPIKHMKVVKLTRGKRLALSHAGKRVAPKHV